MSFIETTFEESQEFARVKWAVGRDQRSDSGRNGISRNNQRRIIASRYSRCNILAIYHPDASFLRDRAMAVNTIKEKAYLREKQRGI